MDGADPSSIRLSSRDPDRVHHDVMDVREVLDDLVAEQQALDDVVARLTTEEWQLATPSPGWTIADQIGHLAYFDGTAALAITDPAGFTEEMNRLLGAGTTGESADDQTIVVVKRRPKEQEETPA